MCFLTDRAFSFPSFSFDIPFHPWLKQLVSKAHRPIGRMWQSGTYKLKVSSWLGSKNPMEPWGDLTSGSKPSFLWLPKGEPSPKPVLKLKRDWGNEQRGFGDEKKVAGPEGANPAGNGSCFRARQCKRYCRGSKGFPRMQSVSSSSRDSASCLSHWILMRIALGPGQDIAQWLSSRSVIAYPYASLCSKPTFPTHCQ